MRAMSFFITLGLSLASGAALAQPAASTAPKAQTISTLNGKFAFTLPPGYTTTKLPPADQYSEAAGAKGMMYMNDREKRVVVTTEVPIPNGEAGDDDDEFLDGAAAGFIKQQAAALPDFKKTREKRVKIRNLGVEQIDSTATMGGGETMTTTFVAGSGKTMSLVQVISRASDGAGHAAMVKHVTEGK